MIYPPFWFLIQSDINRIHASPSDTKPTSLFRVLTFTGTVSFETKDSEDGKHDGNRKSRLRSGCQLSSWLKAETFCLAAGGSTRSVSERFPYSGAELDGAPRELEEAVSHFLQLLGAGERALSFGKLKESSLEGSRRGRRAGRSTIQQLPQSLWKDFALGKGRPRVGSPRWRWHNMTDTVPPTPKDSDSNSLIVNTHFLYHN